MSSDTTGDQPPIMEVEDLLITTNNTNEPILLQTEFISKLCHIVFDPNLTKSAQVEYKQ